MLIPLYLMSKKEKEHVVTCDKGLTCDIINESFYKPIVVAPTNPSCSTSTSTSSSSGGFTCDASLMVENETLKEVNELTHALGKAYGGEDCLLMFPSSQRASPYKEGLGYTPKKGKVAFATPKASFVKSIGRFCNRCKQVGHLDKIAKRTRTRTMLMYPQFVLILVTYFLRVPMV